MSPTQPELVKSILAMYRDRGDSAYYGEDVSQTEHALQSAALAESEGAPPALVVAALLHDVGHMLHGEETAADHGIDDRHEVAGRDWLARHFVAEVAEPVRLHVAAKRYLCAVEPGYFAGLSAASVTSLGLQGGPFDARECAEFEGDPHARAAVRLRRWDDRAKIPGLDVPGLDHYRALLIAALRRPESDT